MKTRRTLAIALATAIGLTVLLMGCSNDSTSTSEDLSGLNLTAEFGGYDATDEARAFGDEDIATLMREDQTVDDPLLADTDIDSLEELAGTQVFMMAIRWGMLEFDSTITQVTDWSGSLKLKHGLLHLRRLLRFERGQDHIVRPRPDRQTVEWVSKTTVSFDGLLLTVIVPPTPEGEDWSDNELSFQTGPYSRTFDIDELADLEELVDIDEIGNQVAFNAKGRTLTPCAAGHLEGRWVLNPSGKNGHFFGRWLAEDGGLHGHLRGHFGARPNGERVFFGKCIDTSGTFKGLLRGVWGVNPDNEGSGWFRGAWAGRNGRPIGLLHGRWSSTPLPEIESQGESPGHGHGRGRDPKNHPVFGSDGWTSGYFGGLWERLCPEVDSNGE